MRVGPDDFCPWYYLDLYQDVADSPFFGRDAGQAVRHYRHWGIKEGRSPNPFFMAKDYLSRYPDLVNAFGSDNYEAALKHWIQFGIDEGRRGSPAFDSRFYLQSYPDLIAAFGSTGYRAACVHWLQFGMRESRRSIPELSGPVVDQAARVSGEAMAAIEVNTFLRDAASIVTAAAGGATWQGRVGLGVAIAQLASDLWPDIKAFYRDRFGHDIGDPIIKADGSMDLPGNDPDRPIA